MCRLGGPDLGLGYVAERHGSLRHGRGGTGRHGKYGQDGGEEPPEETDTHVHAA
jgi:hypothetical protein